MHRVIMFVSGVLLSWAATAADFGVTVSDAWGRATAPGQDSGSVQLTITSKKEAKLISIASPLATSVELHSMIHEDGKMKMRAVDSIALPAGKTVDLGESGYHIMLINLKQPLKEGTGVPLKLTVEFADNHKATLDVKAEIKSQTASHDMGDMKDMKGMSY